MPRAAEDTVLGRGGGSRRVCPSEGTRLVRRGGPRGLGQSQPAGPGHQRAPLRQAGRDWEGRLADGAPGSQVRPQPSLWGGGRAPGPGWVTCRARGRPVPLSVDCPGRVQPSSPPPPSPEAGERVCWQRPRPHQPQREGPPGGKGQEDLRPARRGARRVCTGPQTRMCEPTGDRIESLSAGSRAVSRGMGGPCGWPLLATGPRATPRCGSREYAGAAHCRMDGVGGTPCGPGAETALPVQVPRFDPRSGSGIPRATAKTQRSQINSFTN